MYCCTSMVTWDSWHFLGFASLASTIQINIKVRSSYGDFDGTTYIYMCRVGLTLCNVYSNFLGNLGPKWPFPFMHGTMVVIKKRSNLIHMLNEKYTNDVMTIMSYPWIERLSQIACHFIPLFFWKFTHTLMFKLVIFNPFC